MGNGVDVSVDHLLVWLYDCNAYPAAGVISRLQAAEDDEAEYAWLPPESLKPFMPGDLTGEKGGSTV